MTLPEHRTDVLTPEQRQLNMSHIRGKGTKPELTVRRLLHASGLRYRLHGAGLPGHPDLVFPKYRAVIFVHGCFWHRHHCPLFHWPKSRQEFWWAKLTRNVERDEETTTRLLEAGWRVLTVWECALRGRGRLPPDVLTDQIQTWLAGTQVTGDLPDRYPEPGPPDAGPGTDSAAKDSGRSITFYTG